MRILRLLLMVLLVISVAACAKSSKRGKGGAGDALDVDEAGGGNIPLAAPGSELKDVNFDYDSSVIGSREQATLEENSKWLVDNPDKSFVIEGHCDERGTSEYNLALGEKRALAAYDFLRDTGVKRERMSTISYGEELPLNPGHTEDAWAENRRAHFSLK